MTKTPIRKRRHCIAFHLLQSSPVSYSVNLLLCQEVVAQKEPEVEQIYEAAPAVEFEAETSGVNDDRPHSRNIVTPKISKSLIVPKRYCTCILYNY